MKQTLIATGPLPSLLWAELGLKVCDDLSNKVKLHIINIQPNYTKPGGVGNL